MLKCKIHKKDSELFCKMDKEWICKECFPNHSDHFDQTIKGDGEHIHYLIHKSRDVFIA